MQKIISLVIIAFMLLSFNACNMQEEINPVDNTIDNSETLDAKLIGKLHNDGLDFLFGNSVLKNSKTIQTLDVENILLSMTDFLVTNEGFNLEEVTISCEEVKPLLNEYFVSNSKGVITENEKIEILKNQINFIAEQNSFSSEFTAHIINSLYTENFNSNEDVIEYLNNLSSQNWSENEMLYLNTYKEIAIASNIFWTDYLNKSGDKPSDTEWVIINDGIGGLIGLGFGGAGSVILATAFSYGCAHELGMD